MPGNSEDTRPSRGQDAARRERRRYRHKACGRRLLILVLAEIGLTFSAFLISRCEYMLPGWSPWYTLVVCFGAAVTFTSIVACGDTLKICICEDSNLSGFNTCSRMLTALLILGFLGIQAFIFVWRYRYGCPSSTNLSLGRLARSAADEEWAATYKLQLVSHEAWSNRSVAAFPRLRHPAPLVVLSHSAGPSCTGPAECGPVLRDQQQPDILHNFLIDSAGYVYVGRGADVVGGIQSPVWNCSLEVALLGDYNKHNVEEDTVVALRLLLEMGVSSGWLAADYRLVVHTQLDERGPHSPGRWAMAAVQHWPQCCLSSCAEGLTCPVA
ncbi:uncharacterized protein LOC126187980 [Schistocerca cancellata]|uniref:uncharacterized protein LOC126187980 n=1 Tax=Schistocerca cancellata TaxID=274614 RepID=UPI002117D336|nr:uncharacterized protein LOC126187980 [Schistocerca cancellata]